MQMSQRILVTGGAGYIGSHTVLQLLLQDYEVIVFDNLSNSSQMVLSRIKKITNKNCKFIEGDIRDRDTLRSVFKKHKFDAVMHFAGLKAVGESSIDPLSYYDNNVNGSIILFEEMMRSGVNTVVFSSSATVYGYQDSPRYYETMTLSPINVYGRTKLMVEDILRDLKRSSANIKIAILRYFNPVGAHFSGHIGENPLGTPNNLVPFIAQVAVGKKSKFFVYGDDYNTPDGTGLRDYIHVEDLASGHLAALERVQNDESLLTVNLGTGRPHSVLEVIKSFEKALGREIPYEIVGRRFGDLAEYYSDSSMAKNLLGWQPKFDLDRMCADALRWQTNNPNGYDDN
jgi:UDP-glucose 4-epimerase